MQPNPFSLDEAYARYKDNKGIGRADMIGLLVDAVTELRARIGAVDEAAVAALDRRLTALELTIGNALRLSGEAYGDVATFHDDGVSETTGDGWPVNGPDVPVPPRAERREDMDMDYGRIQAFSIDGNLRFWRPGSVSPNPAPVRRGPGRPRKVVAELNAAEAVNG